MNKKLYRNEYNKVLGGVCSGLAEYFDMDVTIVRLLFAFTFFVMGVGLGTYIILWIVLPRKGYPYNNNYNNPTVDYTVPPQQPENRYATPPPPAGNAFGGSNYGDNPFVSSAPGGNPFGGNPFGGNPVNVIPPKQKSHAGVIIGFVLIMIGAAILVDEYDLIPDFDFETYWPIILVLIGGALIVSGQVSKQPWDKNDLNTDNNTATAATEEPSSTTDNEPTV